MWASKMNRQLIAGFLALVALSGSAAAQSDYPDVPFDPGTGAYHDFPAVSEVQACPETAKVAEGSKCQLVATGGGEFAWEVVVVGSDRPFCDRVEPPPGTDAVSCQVLDVERGSAGDSALVSLTTTDGEEVRVWVMPGEGNQIVLG
jgi:hypothetical protein